MSATVISSIVAGYNDVTNIEHRLVSNYWGLLVRKFGVFRQEHFGWNAMGYGKRFNLLVKPFSAAVYPGRFFVNICNKFKVGFVNSFVSMPCKHNCFHAFIIRQTESNVKSNYKITTDSTL